jgi:glutamine phosphoribosylpyrophosphate amidotransferase
MCAVIGLHSNDFLDMNMLRSVLDQSMIRGKHATGIAYIDDGLIKWKILPTHAKDFVLPDIQTKQLIAHCRYSTSDLDWNQPMYSQEHQVALVHNGVITQASPESWPETYGYDFATKCDSEIAMRMWIDDKHPLELGEDSSMSCVVLDNRANKPYMHFFRNNQRPLYYAVQSNTTIVASTRDIMMRSGITPDTIRKTDMCKSYKISDAQITYSEINLATEDLQ